MRGGVLTRDALSLIGAGPRKHGAVMKRQFEVTKRTDDMFMVHERKRQSGRDIWIFVGWCKTQLEAEMFARDRGELITGYEAEIK
jgi:hypothetical protein